ncbi:MAG: hypothetical protein IIB65_13765 [Proteobacteria bacterium]|nr:hypothetical protein [Pseudomonadota bacterium]
MRHPTYPPECDDLRSIGEIADDQKVTATWFNFRVDKAASEKRPIIKLAEPLRFRPKPGAVRDENLMVRLEGLFITRGKDFGSTADTPLIKKAALRSLEIIECTLDPGGAAKLDGTRSKIRRSMTLSTVSAGKFTSPEIIIQRTISGPLRIDDSYEFYVRIPANTLTANAGAGNCNIVNGYVIVPAANDGSDDITLATAIPVPAADEDNPDGYWDVDDDGVVTASATPGAAKFHLLTVEQKPYLMRAMPLLGPRGMFDIDAYELKFIHHRWFFRLDAGYRGG